LSPLKFARAIRHFAQKIKIDLCNLPIDKIDKLCYNNIKERGIKMKVDDKRLKTFIAIATRECYYCPLKYHKSCKCRIAKTHEEIIRPCKEYVLDWLRKKV
jgi:hypothetical protein